MPIGGGVLPATGSTQYTELTYVTRRAFIPKLVVQIYNSTPLMAALIANAQIAVSIPPAAPSRWPVIDFVELTATFRACAPNTVLMAVVSHLSPTGVEVP